VASSPAGSIDRPYAYLIWRDPWMVDRTGGRFIASMLAAVGLLACADCSRVDAGRTIRSIPSPIPGAARQHRHPGVERAISLPSKREALLSLGRPVAIVDGESFSWFGSGAFPSSKAWP
jgi:hypothetical protein